MCKGPVKIQMTKSIPIQCIVHLLIRLGDNLGDSSLKCVSSMVVVHPSHSECDLFLLLFVASVLFMGSYATC